MIAVRPVLVSHDNEALGDVVVETQEKKAPFSDMEPVRTAFVFLGSVMAGVLFSTILLSSGKNPEDADWKVKVSGKEYFASNDKSQAFAVYYRTKEARRGKVAIFYKDKEIASS